MTAFIAAWAYGFAGLMSIGTLGSVLVSRRDQQDFRLVLFAASFAAFLVLAWVRGRVQ